MYCTAHDIKVPFYMPEFSNRKIIKHSFHADNDKGDLVIGYVMITGRDLMVQLGLSYDFKHKVLQWDGAKVHMKEPRGLLGKSDLNKHEMCEVVLQTTKPASTRKSTERMINSLTVPMQSQTLIR